jgi:hypothetical protein
VHGPAPPGMTLATSHLPLTSAPPFLDWVSIVHTALADVLLLHLALHYATELTDILAFLVSCMATTRADIRTIASRMAFISDDI